MMSRITVRYFSQYLLREVCFDMILPDGFGKKRSDGKAGSVTRTLMILHGWTGNGGNWVPEEFASRYNFAIVMPNGENGFWLDGQSTGRKYQSMIGVEIIEYLRNTFGLATCAQDTYIMGLSMGGFGALHTAFAYPETFGTAIALSSALIIKKLIVMKPGDPDSHANYEYYRDCFGELSELGSSMNNPEVQVKDLIARNVCLPKIYMACGTEDFLIENNREFHLFLEEQGVEHVYFEAAGNHDSRFWDMCVAKFIPEIFSV